MKATALLEMIAWALVILSAAAYLAMNFTGGIDLHVFIRVEEGNALVFTFSDRKAG